LFGGYLALFKNLWTVFLNGDISKSSKEAGRYSLFKL
jgi:hypothetical protein